jgi:hypothetical protein
MANSKSIGVAFLDQDVIGSDFIYSSGELGYTQAATGVATQLTSKATGVTLNTSCGTITMNAESLAAATNATFTLTNSRISTQDAIILSIVNGTATLGSYTLWTTAIAAGSAKITLRNITAGALLEAVVFNFVIVHAGA